jgi:hypothetical protein
MIAASLIAASRECEQKTDNKVLLQMATIAMRIADGEHETIEGVMTTMDTIEWRVYRCAA